MSADYPFRLPALAATVVTTSSEEARAWATHGLAWLFAYHHEEATVCFKAAISAAAAEGTVCPMASWGVAYCAMPDYNDGAKDFLAAHFGADAAKAQDVLQQALAEVAQLQASITDPERLVIEALSARGTWDGDDADGGKPAYALAMQKVHASCPDNPDVAALFAEAVITQSPCETIPPRSPPTHTFRDVFVRADFFSS